MIQVGTVVIMMMMMIRQMHSLDNNDDYVSEDEEDSESNASDDMSLGINIVHILYLLLFFFTQKDFNFLATKSPNNPFASLINFMHAKGVRETLWLRQTILRETYGYSALWA